MSRIRLFLEWLAILACALALVWWAAASGVTARLDGQLLDLATARRASAAAEDILIVAIDDRSLAAEGQWPWDRARVALLVDLLHQSGARAIALDILFIEPTAPASDAALAAAMARAGNVALPYGFVPAQDRLAGFDPQLPLPEIGAQAITTGQVVMEADPDGPVRRVPPVVHEGNRGFEHLQLALYRQLEGRDPPGGGALRGAGQPPVLPLRPSGAFRTVSAAALLAGEVPAGFVRGKVALVGATAQGLGDIHPVPAHAGRAMPGVEVQANFLQALRENAFVRPLGLRDVLWYSMLPILLLFLGFWRLRPSLCLALALALGLGTLAAAFALAASAGIWFPPGPALLAILAAYPLWGWRRLAAVSDFLRDEAGKLAGGEVVAPLPAQTLGGFDNVAKQVSLLGYLVDEVAERRAFLTKVIETAPDAICVFGGDSRLLLMNGKARSIFGDGQAGVALGDLIASVRGTLADDGREMALPDGSAFAMARSQAQGEPAESGWRTIEIVAFVDITDIRRAEEERRQMLEFLSHDMRSPQVSILGLAAERRDQLTAGERFARIIGHARRTLKLADDFVHLSRIAEAPLVRDEVNLGMLVEECIDRAWFAAREKQVAISQNLPDEPVYLRADGEMLSRAIDNLLGNAIKYGPQGSTVTVHAVPSGGEVRLTIADEGPGLPEGRREDPFRRFGARDHRDGSGAGLGLAFVRAAVEKHGGAIACLSGVNGGTIFILSLPCEGQAEV